VTIAKKAPQPSSNTTAGVGRLSRDSVFMSMQVDAALRREARRAASSLEIVPSDSDSDDSDDGGLLNLLTSV
jgi:hypothetical protein